MATWPRNQGLLEHYFAIATCEIINITACNLFLMTIRATYIKLINKTEHTNISQIMLFLIDFLCVLLNLRKN